MSYAKSIDYIEPINLEILTSVRMTVYLGLSPLYIVYVRMVQYFRWLPWQEVLDFITTKSVVMARTDVY